MKVDADAKRELERSAHLLGRSQRDVLDRLVLETLPAFTKAELERLEAEGTISAAERHRRERELAVPIAVWSPRLVDLPVVEQPGLLERLRDWLLR